MQIPLQYIIQHGNYCYQLYPYQTKDWMTGKIKGMHVRFCYQSFCRSTMVQASLRKYTYLPEQLLLAYTRNNCRWNKDQVLEHLNLYIQSAFVYHFIYLFLWGGEMGIVNSCSSNLDIFNVTVYSYAYLYKCFSTIKLLVALTILEEPLGCLDFLNIHLEKS